MKKNRILLLMTCMLLLSACTGLGFYKSNGERIYFTGKNADGKAIAYSGGPVMGMMGGQLACVSCHGADGRGGVHTMHMQTMDAPDIHFTALADHASDEDHGHDDAHTEGYTLEQFRLAVVGGVHPDGTRLDTDMPHWLLSEQDLADLFEYVGSLE